MIHGNHVAVDNYAALKEMIHNDYNGRVVDMLKVIV